jgi:hypothetical protein
MAVAPAYVSSLPMAQAYHVPGDLKEVIATGTVGAADTYVTGGFTIDLSVYGLNSIVVVDTIVFSTGHWGIYVPGTTTANGKIKVFSAAATELVNASAALQNATFVVQVLGK